MYENVENTGCAETFVDPLLLERLLTPYKKGCRYLKSAWTMQGDGQRDGGNLAVAGGRFAIPKSFYIQDTGHFNAVEFNLCFNQIGYALVAVCIQHGWIVELPALSMEEFTRRQLPDMVIVKLSSAFHRPMRAASFEGRLSITKASVNSKGTVFMTMECSFTDGQGGYSDGSALTAIINPHGHH